MVGKRVLAFGLSDILFNNGAQEAVDKISSKYNCEPEDVSFVLNGSFSENYRTGRLTIGDFWKDAAKKLKIQSDADLRLMFFNSFHINEDCVDLLKELSDKYTVGFISNSPEDKSVYLDTIHRYIELFHFGVFSYEAHARKPSVEIYKYFLEKNKLKPNEVTYIDTTEENLASARSLGVTTIKFTSIEQLKKDLTLLDDKTRKKVILQTYEAIVDEYAKNNFYAQEWDKFYKKFQASLPVGASILDAGCGPGQASKYFAARGYTVTGVDISKSMLDYATSKGPKAVFKIGNVENLNVKGKFDGIWCAFVLSHIKREKHLGIVKKFAARLKFNGSLMLGFLEGNGQRITPDPYGAQCQQFFVYTPEKEARALVEKAGLTVVSYDAFNFDENGEKFKRSFLLCQKLEKPKNSTKKLAR